MADNVRTGGLSASLSLLESPDTRDPRGTGQSRGKEVFVWSRVDGQLLAPLPTSAVPQAWQDEEISRGATADNSTHGRVKKHGPNAYFRRIIS